MEFKVKFTTRALKDLRSFPITSQKAILEEAIRLETNPFSFKKKIKKISGIKFPCYRLGIDLPNDTCRLFYGIDKNDVFALRIVSKKDADKVIANLRKSDFPPPVQN